VKEEKGSLSIEALISMTLTFIIVTASISMCASLYFQQLLEIKMLESTEVLKYELMAVRSDINLLEKIPAELAIEQRANRILTNSLEDEQQFFKDVSSLHSRLFKHQYFEWQVNYTIVLPFFTVDKTFCLPISGVVTGDVVLEESDETTDHMVVYITKTGDRYHRPNCQYLWHSKIETTKEKAQKGFYIPCKICNPDH